MSRPLNAKCQTCGAAVVYTGPDTKHECQRKPAVVTYDAKAAGQKATKRAGGERHEAALARALSEADYYDLREFTATDQPFAGNVFVRGYAWGLYLDPPRKFQADAAFPAARLLVEVEGQVHSIKGKRHGDVLRRQLAEGAGWRVLSVLPSQVHDGTAVRLVREALAAR